MYYVLESKPLPLITHLSYSGDDGWGLDFLQGRIKDVSSNSSDLFTEVEHKYRELPDYFEVDCVPVVRKKFVDCLESAGVDSFQVFPINIHFEDKVVDDYFLLNVVGCIKCFDESNTDCKKVGPCVMRVHNLKLKDNFAYGQYMFRAREYKAVIFINEITKNKIDNANITGCTLMKADGWNDKHRF